LGENNIIMAYRIILLVLVSAIVILPQNSFGQVADRDVGILPDSPFYNFKLFWENLQEGFTFNEERRAELILEHAEIRKAEVDLLELRGIPIPERILQLHDEKIERARLIIETLEAGLPPQPVSAVRQIIIDQSEDRPIVTSPLQKIQDIDSDQTIVDKLRERLSFALSDNQIIEIKEAFQELREEEDPQIREELAKDIDDEVNNPIVNISCLGRISSLDIADSPDPVGTLQDQCAFLKPIPTDQLRIFLNQE